MAIRAGHATTRSARYALGPGADMPVARIVALLLILLPIVFLFPAVASLTGLKIGIFLLGVMTIAQFSFWGNYLPRVYPTYLRGTGESFAANVGGRMFGTTAALVTTQLVNFMPGSSAPTRLAFAAAFVGTTVYLIGFLASFRLPEPKHEELPD